MQCAQFFAPPNARTIARRAIGIAALFAVLAAAGILFSKLDGRIAAIWCANAAVLVFLLRNRAMPLVPVLGAVFVANVGVGTFVGDPPVRAVGLAIANAVEIALAAGLLRRACPEGVDPRRFKPVRTFLLLAGVVAPLASAIVAAAVEAIAADGSVRQTFVRWLLADAIGMMLVGLCALILLDCRDGMKRPTRSQLLDWLIQGVIGTVVIAGVFIQDSYPLLFLVGPVVVVHALRHGTLGAAVSTIKIAVIAIAATVLDSGPIAKLVLDGWARIVVLETFLLTVLLLGVPVAALLEDQRRTSASLAEREFQLSLLTDYASDGVMAFDRRGRCSYASAAAEHLIRRPRADLLGQPWWRLIEPEDRAQAWRLAKLLLRTEGPETVTIRRPGKRGASTSAYLAARCKQMPLVAGADHIAIVVSLRDVTDLVWLEREKSAAMERAEQAAAAKSRFLANMSHEIRTPMNGVLGFAELLLDSPLDEGQRRKLNLIVDSGKSMMRLLNDILDLSKIEAGKFDVANEPFALWELIESCVTLSSVMTEQKGLKLRCSFDPDLPHLVRGDQLRIRQILLNLIGNAAKFTERGELTVIARRKEDVMEIGVRDTGIGIASEHLQAMFEPFEQGSTETARRFGGTGLGLAISAQLARLMGGSLKAESTLGEGSTFVVELPLIEEADRRLVARPPHTASAYGVALRGERILVADDHDINRELALEMLRSLKFDVTLANDGFEAIAAVREAAAANRPYSLVLMDLQMPNCDGYAASRAIRVAGFSPQVLPIVALTATTYPEDIRAALDAGMQDHVAKPIAFERLRQVASRWALHEVPPETPQSRPSGMAITADERLVTMWMQTRARALSQVETFLAGDGGEIARDELARQMHLFTGTAAQFGEGELGHRAAELEAALRHEAPQRQVRQLALVMLERAAPC